MPSPPTISGVEVFISPSLSLFKVWYTYSNLHFFRFQVGRSVDETLRLVQAFQYTDKHGEVCPAGWKPGKETIIPDPTEKKKYFAKQTEKGEAEEL